MSERTGGDWSDDRDLSSIDLSQVADDDALLDALSGTDPRVADEFGNPDLNALLLSWSREVDGEPMPELVDVDTAVTTIRAAALARKHSQRERRRRLLIPVAAAAAVLAIAFGGAGIAARDAEPGDALWGLTKVLYAEKARSVEAATEVREDLEVARTALSRGEVDTARQKLDDAKVSLEKVTEEENRDVLENEFSELMTKVTGEQPPPTNDQDQREQPQAPVAADSSTTSPTSPTTSPTTEPSEPTEPTVSPSTPPPTTSPTEPEPTTSPAPTSTPSSDAQPTGSSTSSGGTGSTSSGHSLNDSSDTAGAG